jgi:hypothetical protein
LTRFIGSRGRSLAGHACQKEQSLKHLEERMPPLASFTTNPQITAYARNHIDEHAYRVFPGEVGGTPIGELNRLASGSSPGDRCVYIVLSLDQMKGRLGKGAIRARMQGHLGAVISHLAPGAPFKWSAAPSMNDMIVANGFRLPYVILADGMSIG